MLAQIAFSLSAWQTMRRIHFKFTTWIWWDTLWESCRKSWLDAFYGDGICRLLVPERSDSSWIMTEGTYDRCRDPIGRHGSAECQLMWAWLTWPARTTTMLHFSTFHACVPIQLPVECGIQIHTQLKGSQFLNSDFFTTSHVPGSLFENRSKINRYINPSTVLQSLHLCFCEHSNQSTVLQSLHLGFSIASKLSVSWFNIALQSSFGILLISSYSSVNTLLLYVNT